MVVNFNMQRLLFWASIFALLLKLISSKSIAEDMVVTDRDGVFAYIFDMVIVISSVLSVRIIHRKFSFFYFSFLFALICLCISSFVYQGDLTGAIKTVLRVYAPLFALAHYASHYSINRGDVKSSALLVVCIVFILFSYSFLYMPMSINRVGAVGGHLWWPSYFENIHTTAYVVVAVFFILYTLYRNQIIHFSDEKMAFLYIMFFFSLLSGWGIRTAALAMIVFAIGILFERYFASNKKIFIAVFILFLTTMFVYSYLFFSFEAASAYSSGRLSMYMEKYQQLASNSFFAWIFGNGAGSDLIESEVWYWGLKGAHSDFITALVEGGGVYFLVFVGIHAKLYKMCRYDGGRLMVFSIFVTGLFSNGFFARPLAMYLAVIALAISYASNHGSDYNNSGDV